MPEPVIVQWKSTNFLDATITDEAGSPVVGAAVTLTLSLKDGPDVAGPSWPVTMEDQGGGVYRYVIPATLALALGGFYVAKVTATSGSFVRYSEPVLEVLVDRD